MTVPEGWKSGRLEEHSDVIVSPVDKKSHLDEQRVLLCNYMDVYSNERITSDIDFMEATASAREIDKYNLRKGDVLITKDSETPDDIARPAYVAESLWNVLCGYHLAILRPDETVLDGAFLANYLDSHLCRSHFSSRASGATRFGLTVRSICEAPILLPPLPEQKKIATILSSVDKTIRATRETIEQTRKVKQGLMQELLTRGIGHTRFKKTADGMTVPEGWKLGEVEEIVINRKGAIKIGPFGSQLKKDEMLPDGVKVYGQENVFKADFTTGDRFVSEEKYNMLKTCQLSSGDIVLTMMGTIGAAAIFPDNALMGVMDSHLLRIQANTNIADRRFLLFLLRDSPYTKLQISRMSQGGIMSGLNAGIVKSIKLLLPPLAEQKKIAAILSSVDDDMHSAEANLQQLEILKKGLMQDLLTGQVRVAV